MFFCAGTATSTFGGGGGTKVFCSQAVSARAARATDTLRIVALARSRNKTFIFEDADACACLISGLGTFLFSKRLFSQKAAARHPMKIATIRLQWNPKPKMMPPAKVVLPT